MSGPHVHEAYTNERPVREERNKITDTGASVTIKIDYIHAALQNEEQISNEN